MDAILVSPRSPNTFQRCHLLLVGVDISNLFEAILMFVLIHPGSRRQSFSSLPSQSSIKSVSSVRSQHSYRNLYQHDRSNHGHLSKAGVRGGHDTYRKASSPLERSSGYLPNHLPDHSNHIRAKCSNTRCGTNSKVKSVSFCSRCP